MVDDAERSDYDRAATGYLVWPAALLALARESPTASTWTRIHNRQAVTYGLLISVAYLIVLAVPLAIVIGFSSISTGATVLVYGIGLTVDLIAFVALVALTLGYSSRAARGELFLIPVVSAVADRVFRLHR